MSISPLRLLSTYAVVDVVVVKVSSVAEAADDDDDPNNEDDEDDAANDDKGAPGALVVGTVVVTYTFLHRAFINLCVER